MDELLALFMIIVGVIFIGLLAIAVALGKQTQQIQKVDSAKFQKWENHRLS